MPTAHDFDAPGHPKTNPVTGPFAVEGAEPGDALAITILDITLDAEGFIIDRPEWGVVKNSVPHQVARMLPIDGDAVVFDNARRIPLRPNIGTMGTAPAREGVSSIHCGGHGGNMVSNAVAVGTGCEIGAKVTVKIELVKEAWRG